MLLLSAAEMSIAAPSHRLIERDSRSADSCLNSQTSWTDVKHFLKEKYLDPVWDTKSMLQNLLGFHPGSPVDT